MPDLQRIIEIVFQGTDNVGGSVTSVAKGLDAVASKAQDVTGPLASIADTVVKVDLAIAGLGAAVLGFAFNESVRFESAILDLQKVLSDSEGSVDQYIPRIEELGNTYGVASNDVISAAANFSQSGFRIKEALDLTDLALKAVKISELDANEASGLLISTLRGFGAEASEAGRVLDVLNAVSNNYAVSVGELGRGMADLSPVARTANLTFEETAGILTPVIEIFGSGSEAAVALKTSLLRLGSDTKGVVDALAALGVAQKDAGDELRASGDILKDLAKVWPGLTKSQQSYYAAELVGINQAPKFQAVLTNYETVLGATETALTGAGSAQREWAVRMGAAEEVINRAKVSFTSLLRVIGDQYRDEMKGAIGATGDLAKAFSDLVKSGGLEPLFAHLRPLLAGIEDDLSAVAKALPGAFAGLDLGPVTSGFEAIGKAVSELFEGADIRTAEGLQKVLQDFVNIGGGFLQVTAGMIEGLTPALRLLAELGQTFGEASPEAQQLGGEILGIGKSLNTLLSLVSPVADGLGSIGIGLQAIAGASVLKTITGLGDGFAALATKLGAAGAAAGAWAFAVGQMSTAIDEYNERNEAYRKAVEGLDETEARRAKSLAEVGRQIGLAIPSMDDFNRLADEGKIIFDEATGTWRQAAIVLGENATAQDAASEANKGLLLTEKELAVAFSQANDLISAGSTATSELSSNTETAVKWTVEIIDGVKTYTQAIGSKTSAQSKDIASTKAAGEETEKFRLELEKIASDERLANIEARVSLEIADVQANAEIAVAAFESLNVGIQSTGELLGELYGLFADADGFRDKWFLQDEIERERELREKEFDLQGRLLEKQIRYLDEKTRSLARGDALITISGDGLEPELEAFMWKIIERVQIRASDEGAEFLLGIP